MTPPRRARRKCRYRSSTRGTSPKHKPTTITTPPPGACSVTNHAMPVTTVRQPPMPASSRKRLLAAICNSPSGRRVLCARCFRNSRNPAIAINAIVVAAPPMAPDPLATANPSPAATQAAPTAMVIQSLITIGLTGVSGGDDMHFRSLALSLCLKDRFQGLQLREPGIHPIRSSPPEGISAAPHISAVPTVSPPMIRVSVPSQIPYEEASFEGLLAESFATSLAIPVACRLRTVADRVLDGMEGSSRRAAPLAGFLTIQVVFVDWVLAGVVVGGSLDS